MEKMNKIELMMIEVVKKILSLETDVKKFDRGNSVAGIRLRANIQVLKKMLQEVRMQIQVIKHKRKAQKKLKKIDKRI